MNKSSRAEALIISLWILLILALLAVAIGHRVSMALRLSRYQKDRIKAVYLAKAGVNRATVEITTNDQTATYDSLQDKWVNNEEVFKRIVFSDNPNEFAEVSYNTTENGEEARIYGVVDEERKININMASAELLLALLEEAQVTDAQKKVNNMRAWRGDVDSSIPMEARDYANLGYTCKAKPFNNAAELLLVKDITPTDYDKLKGLITIYGNDSKIDINTVSSQVLNIVACAVAKNLSVIEGVATDLASRIIELRNTKVYFTSIGDIQDSLTLNADEQSIFDALMPLVKFQSDNFFIEVCGNINKIKSRVQAVYNRTNKNILYWHES